MSTSAYSLTSSVGSSLGDLDNVELVQYVEKMRMENRLTMLENMILENYLLRIEPSLIATMEQVLESANKVAHAGSMSTTIASSSSLTRGDANSSTSTASRPGGTQSGPGSQAGKVNLEQRIEMTQREIEDIQGIVEVFMKMGTKMKAALRAELEEIAERTQETQTARESFEQNVVINAVNPITGRVPGEKLIRYMDEWLRLADLKMEKLRLRTSNFRIQYAKLKVQLAQKEELGETVYPIDFDQLKIENHEFLEKIEVKNQHLLELKKMTGHASLVLSIQKKFVMEQCKEISDIQQKIKMKQDQVIQNDHEADAVEREVNSAAKTLQQMQYLIDNYTVPNVMDYVHKRAELRELQKMVKVWTRRKNIQQIELTSCRTRMKRLTGSSKLQPRVSVSKKSSAEVIQDMHTDMEFLRKLHSYD